MLKDNEKTTDANAAATNNSRQRDILRRLRVCLKSHSQGIIDLTDSLNDDELITGVRQLARFANAHSLSVEVAYQRGVKEDGTLGWAVLRDKRVLDRRNETFHVGGGNE